MNRNCLSYWFPKLAAAGLPVPRTEIVRTPVDLAPLLDGRTPDGWDGFLAEMMSAYSRVAGYGHLPPVFLRTGQGSGKHQWKDTCHLDLRERTLAAHVAALVEWSHVVDFIGLPHDVWCVRELLPTAPVAVLPAYGDMPLVREVRAFVQGGAVVCVHPYWPERAIRQGFPSGTPAGEVRKAVSAARLSKREVLPALLLAEKVAAAFTGDGSWSVDLLETRSGWFVTDMAEAVRSFHWEGCENRHREWGQPK